MVADTVSPASGPKILRAYAFNPEIEPRRRHLSDCDERPERTTFRMVTKDATPVPFIVPDGCDRLDLLFGPIEVNPGVGADSDLDKIVAIGEVKLSANVDGVEGPLVPGDQIIVTVPWRAASWVDLEPGRLRMTVFAHFHAAEAA
jgi:hypothetical protein